jgi:hypothetical protein
MSDRSTTASLVSASTKANKTFRYLENRYADTVVLTFAIEDLLALRFRTKRASTKSAGRTQRST